MGRSFRNANHFEITGVAIRLTSTTGPNDATPNHPECNQHNLSDPSGRIRRAAGPTG